jgi:hypothetical protein
MSRDERAHKESNWTCFLCTANHESNQHADLDESIDETSKGMKSFTKSSLRILQWNTNGLKSKSDELGARLHASDIDVAVIQESWLSKRDNTPIIKDYCAIREDRKVNIKRGGLIFYLKKSIPYDMQVMSPKRATKFTQSASASALKNGLPSQTFTPPCQTPSVLKSTST